MERYKERVGEDESEKYREGKREGEEKHREREKCVSEWARERLVKKDRKVIK